MTKVLSSIEALIHQWREWADQLGACDPPSWLAKREAYARRNCADQLAAALHAEGAPQLEVIHESRSPDGDGLTLTASSEARTAANNARCDIPARVGNHRPEVPLAGSEPADSQQNDEWCGACYFNHDPALGCLDAALACRQPPPVHAEGAP